MFKLFGISASAILLATLMAQAQGSYRDHSNFNQSFRPSCDFLVDYASGAFEACMQLECLFGCWRGNPGKCQSDYAKDLAWQRSALAECYAGYSTAALGTTTLSQNANRIYDRSTAIASSSGWKYENGSWVLTFPAGGDLPSLGPSFSDQFKQRLLPESLHTIFHVGLDVVHHEAEEWLEKTVGYAPTFFLIQGLTIGTLGVLLAPSVGEQTFLAPDVELPPSGRKPLFTVKSLSSPFVTVDPNSVVIIDPPPAPGSDILDLDTSDAQQLLLRAKQSRDSLISQAQQFESEASQYQSQTQQALTESTMILQSASDRVFWNTIQNIKNLNPSNDAASTGDAWQSFASVMNALANIGQSLQSTNRSSRSLVRVQPQNQPKLPYISPEEQAMNQLLWELQKTGAAAFYDPNPAHYCWYQNNNFVCGGKTTSATQFWQMWNQTKH